MIRVERSTQIDERIRRTNRPHTLSAFFGSAIALNLPVALWRVPGHAESAIAGLNTQERVYTVDFLAGRTGFALAPFVNTQTNAALWIDADLCLTEHGLTFSDQIASSRPKADIDRFVDELSSRLDGPALLSAPWYLAESSDRSTHAADEVEFLDLVGRAIDFIHDTGIAKVVVSRTVERALPEDFDPVKAFLELSIRYPQAFVSLVAIPGVGTWIGASPEILLALEHTTLTTMALAGTQRRPEDRPLSDLRWGAKETTEQEMVSAYIREFFRSARVQDVAELGPRTVGAGNVVHLQTLFRAELPEAERLALANRVLAELHPTSAVCGMPKHKALSFILENEGYDRSFYSGFLGPVHVNGRSSLYVNLRCMRLGERTANLYVGAGITADSMPTAEWYETEIKAETLSAVLQ